MKDKNSNSKVKRIVFIVIGCICFGLGTVGVILPILPTTPFYLVTAYCFARSSKRMEDWFKGTKLYKKHLESFVKKEGMLMSTKIGIISSVTILMGIGFFLMARKDIWVGCIVLGVVWLAHIIYFVFFVKTIKKTENTNDQEYISDGTEQVPHRK